MKTKRLISLLMSLVMIFTVAVFSVPASAKTTELSTTSSFQAYDDYLEKMMTAAHMSGVAYVTQNGQVIAKHARGVKNTQNNEAMETDTLFPIGSVSKQFCATAILLLQEQGKLSVNDTLSKYFPEYEIGKDITIHNLLSMRSGIRDHVNYDEEYIGTESPKEQYTLYKTATSQENIQNITDWLFTQQLKFEPGSQFSYSNTNFLLLSVIVEQVSGENYTDFIKENIFVPLEMTSSGFYEELYNHPDLAEHKLTEGEEPIEPYYHGISQGCGDIVSNAPDIDKWLTSLGECTILSKESFEEMTTNYGEFYGYGIMVDKNHVHHSGNIATYETFALTDLEKNINIFVVTNDIISLMVDGGTDTITLGFAFNNKISSSKAKLGDVDSDSVISILDATALQMHFAQIKTLTTRQLRSGDTDGDGKVSIMDATEIQLHLALN